MPSHARLIDIACQMAALVAPAAIVTAFEASDVPVAAPVTLAIVVALLITAFVSGAEMIVGSRRPGVSPGGHQSFVPPCRVTIIVAAYLPNEAGILLDTIRSCLALEPSSSLQVICSYNTPRPMSIEQELAALSRLDPRFIAHRVHGSTSKAENVNAAAMLASGEICGVLDADHRPAADVLQRARRGIALGADVVQGHCAVREGRSGLLAASVAVEFEAMYGLTHPGRRRCFGFGVFGGSNGWWRTDALRQTLLNPAALTEDIDASIRLVSAGGRIDTDPELLSWELAPPSTRALFNQRQRWAHGWLQVGRNHLRPMLRSQVVSTRAKIGAAWMFAWCPILPWLNIAIPGLVFERALAGELHVGNPTFLSLLVATTFLGIGQTFLAWRCAPPVLKQKWTWFAASLVTRIVLGAVRDAAARSATARLLTNDSQWRITPRSQQAKTSVQTSMAD